VGEASAANDLGAYVDTDREFHAFLLSQTGNQKLAEIVSELRDACRFPGLLKLADEGKLADRQADHHEMMDAIKGGDGERVAQVIRRHMDLTWRGIEQVAEPT
jgi:DNA-binding GntR family transcriptional regulator